PHGARALAALLPVPTRRSSDLGAQRLIRALQPHEQLLVLAIGGTVDVVAPLGPPSETALDAVLRLDLWGTSPIGDSLAAALDTIDRKSTRLNSSHVKNSYAVFC